MNSISKKTSLLILAITALANSRGMFSLFNDPEGPNLLIVVGMAAILFFLSLTAYLSNLSNSKRLMVAIFIQLVIAGAFYVYLK